MNIQEFSRRRNQVFKQIGAGSAAILYSGREAVSSYVDKYPFRPNTDFYYLTGYLESEAVAVFLAKPGPGEFILFVSERDIGKELWLGAKMGRSAIKKRFGVDQVLPLNKIDTVMPKLLANRKRIFFNIGADQDFDQRIMGWIRELANRVRSGVSAPYEFVKLGKIIHELRLKKSKFEIDLMQKAATIIGLAQSRMFKVCTPGMYEYELEAEVLHEFTRQERSAEAFASIIASGNNACTLHYSMNTKRMVSGELVLTDIGVEYQHYCADVSRTFPVNGKFTSKQRVIYDAVLKTQLAVIDIIRPGIRWNSLQELAELVVTNELIKLGLLRGKVKDLVAKKACKKFFMHRIGHWLGMEVHDVGEYRIDYQWRVLEPGMVFTVEPGIYISSKNKSVAQGWRNIGVRIEDDVLVTKNGCKVLTNSIPKAASDIEAMMKK